MASKSKAKGSAVVTAVEDELAAFEHSPQRFFGVAEITCQIPEDVSLEDLTAGLRNLFGSGLAVLERSGDSFSEEQWGALYLLRQAFFVANELNNRTHLRRFTGDGNAA